MSSQCRQAVRKEVDFWIPALTSSHINSDTLGKPTRCCCVTSCQQHTLHLWYGNSKPTQHIKKKEIQMQIVKVKCIILRAIEKTLFVTSSGYSLPVNYGGLKCSPEWHTVRLVDCPHWASLWRWRCNKAPHSRCILIYTHRLILQVRKQTGLLIMYLYTANKYFTKTYVFFKATIKGQTPTSRLLKGVEPFGTSLSLQILCDPSPVRTLRGKRNCPPLITDGINSAWSGKKRKCSGGLSK